MWIRGGVVVTPRVQILSGACWWETNKVEIPSQIHLDIFTANCLIHSTLIKGFYEVTSRQRQLLRPYWGLASRVALNLWRLHSKDKCLNWSEATNQLGQVFISRNTALRLINSNRSPTWRQVVWHCVKNTLQLYLITNTVPIGIHNVEMSLLSSHCRLRVELTFVQ